MKHKQIVRLGAVAGSLAAMAPAAIGQEVGDPQAGQVIAAEVCAECHAVLPGQGVLTDPDPLPFEGAGALAFEDIANTPGVTAMVLSAWMVSTHPTMPLILLEDDELRDIVAYILSLKDEQDL